MVGELNQELHWSILCGLLAFQNANQREHCRKTMKIENDKRTEKVPPCNEEEKPVKRKMKPKKITAQWLMMTVLIACLKNLCSQKTA